ncbi:50S ribosomal protein L25 [Candidatus Wolfebacteria bacterium CG03_land_8_20_14_0_80_40_12]|uniref:Large ribosomal subunit protein bL25 n=1 Tax=Candidatus Wolfebacteria bacterium CG03_land_8_20_14_0_80_40_12 TaxID=1975069 RepID=A0A2M7B5W6_9BACT|nr:MAG: 50S ribosomal protein L25 [Candidatus Wolfebacteria bacterium CG03_land_8_20_14_0_80_40_12]
MELTVQKREILGKKVKTLRKQGIIPAELYGQGFENFHLNAPAKDFLRIFKEAGEGAIIKLKVKDGESKNKEFNVLIHDLQKNALTDEISHIDFYRVRMDKKITSSASLVFIGEAPAVKEKGGILVKLMSEIKVEALPADLPRQIEADLNGLSEIGMNIRVKDLKIGQGVKFLINLETVVAVVTEPGKEEIEIAPINVEEVKVGGEEKKKEEKKEEVK